MHPEVAARIRALCTGERYDSVLEIGATEAATLLTEPPFEAVPRRIGVDLEPWSHPGLELYAANAHDLSMLERNGIDCVLCNAVLEHDPQFWRTLAEIERVAAPGARIVIGVPGYSRRVERAHWLERVGIESLVADLDGPDRRGDSPGTETRSLRKRCYEALPTGLQQRLADGYRRLQAADQPVAAVFGVHDAPGDYYRFSPQAVREVFFRRCRQVEVADLLDPPRLIGTGLARDYSP